MIKIKKIITAINNPKLNEELKKENNFKIIGKDIQYKEAILEILEKNETTDLIIINEKIPGEIKLENLIKKIKLINEKIKIIFILEKENTEVEKILIKNNIIDIYYNNKIDLKELIKIINKEEINMAEEIIKLKKIIEEKNTNEQIKEKNTNKKNINIKIPKKEKKYEVINHNSKIITVSGNYKSGKSTISLLLGEYLSKKYKVLLIDGDLENQNMKTILNKEKKILKKELRKIYINYEYINLNIKFTNRKEKILNCYIKTIINRFIKKINNNIYFFENFKYIVENKKNIENKIIIFFDIIKKYYNFIIIDLSKNNLEKINKEILKISNLDFVLMEPNLFGIKEINGLLNKYFFKWKIDEKKIFIIVNKIKTNSISKDLIKNIIIQKNEIYEIKDKKIFSEVIYKYYIIKNFLNNKKIKKEINNVLKKILN